MKQVLSQEEVAALLQGLAEGQSDLRPGQTGSAKEPQGPEKPGGRRGRRVAPGRSSSLTKF